MVVNMDSIIYTQMRIHAHTHTLISHKYTHIHTRRHTRPRIRTSTRLVRIFCIYVTASFIRVIFLIHMCDKTCPSYLGSLGEKSPGEVLCGFSRICLGNTYFSKLDIKMAGKRRRRDHSELSPSFSTAVDGRAYRYSVVVD